MLSRLSSSILPLPLLSVPLLSVSLLGASLLSTGCAVLPGGGQSGRHSARSFFTTTSYTRASFAPDGKSILVTSDHSGVFNAYSLAIEGGELTPLTASTDNAIFSIGWFPDGERFLYTADQAGNELNHLYVGDIEGSDHDLTPGDDLKARFLGWSRDERSFFALTNERDPEFFDLYRYHFGQSPIEAGAGRAPSTEVVAPGFRRELLFRNPGGFDLSGVSANGVWVALSKINGNADSDVFVVRAEAPDEHIHVTPHEGEVSHGFADFSPDGDKVYYTTNEGSEFDSVWSFDLNTHTRASVFAADWDVSGYGFSQDGRWLSTAVNADARTIVRVFEAATGHEIILPKLPAGDITGVTFEKGGKRLACYVNGDTSPSNLYVLDLASGEYERLTEALNPAIDEDDLVVAQVIRYPSFDDLPIPALLYRPRNATRANPAPALVWVHGGPGGQSRRGYRPTIQHLVNHGYAVLAVNNRGSSGYGKTFNHLDDRRHGDVDLQDCVHARRYLESQAWIDGERVGIIGGSYGGYMVCAALAFTPEAFDVGIDIFGVTNWIRTLESIPPWWASFRDSLYAELGDPEIDRASLEARSPLIHAANIRRPLLVIQGKNDPRVLEAESEEIVAAVRENGVPVEYVLFEDEGHGFRNKENRIKASETYLTFLEQYLRGKPAN